MTWRMSFGREMLVKFNRNTRFLVQCKVFQQKRGALLLSESVCVINRTEWRAVCQPQPRLVYFTRTSLGHKHSTVYINTCRRLLACITSLVPY